MSPSTVTVTATVTVTDLGDGDGNTAPGRRTTGESDPIHIEHGGGNVPVNRAGASTGLHIEVVISGRQRLQRALGRYYGLQEGETL